MPIIFVFNVIDLGDPEHVHVYQHQGPDNSSDQFVMGKPGQIQVII